MEAVQSRNRIIEESCIRSRSFRLLPDSKIVKDILPSKTFNHLLEENRLLVKHSLPILEKTFSRISPFGYVAILCDPEGNILHILGDPKFLKKSEKVCLCPGANWKENIRGTNAIGTAIALQAPVRVHGSEHFLNANSFLTCAASPIRAPDGKLLGILDITGHYRYEVPHSLSLACLAAESIETRLLLDKSRHEKLEILKELDAVSSIATKTIVSLDEDHRIVFLNKSGRDSLGESAIGQEFGSVVNESKLALKSKFQIVYQGNKRIWGYLNQSKELCQSSMDAKYNFDSFYSNCPRVSNLIQLAQKASLQSFPVLILGETGTGKEIIAQSIHNLSANSDKPFIAVNCSAIPDSLIESELFGYEKGAFTGANLNGKIGKFEAANGGTIFLDEIGDMDTRIQATLLRVLQERSVIPIGSNKSRKVDVRIIAATHRNLWEEVQLGKFRQDLYFRLKGIVLKMIPLRERTDIIGLANYLLSQLGYSNVKLAASAQQLLLNYSWPGNIRELKSSLQQAVFLMKNDEITSDLFMLEENNANNRNNIDNHDSLKYFEKIEYWEKYAIELSMKKSEGNISKAAELLNLGRNTLYRKLKKYNISFN